MNVTVDVQCASVEPVPDEEDLRRWISTALASQPAPGGDAEVSVRLVDIEEMTRLNQVYRNKRGPTNVLSFPADLPPELDLPLLGDIVICVPVVRTEARTQHKQLEAHWAHMAVHGTLHLLGFDHLQEDEAAAMENIETAILAELHYPCPYQSHTTQENSLA